jgi:Ca-activated chloride channel homolog
VIILVRRAPRAKVGQSTSVRSVKALLSQVEKATQVRRPRLDEVLAELTQHRDAASDPDLRAALDRLCEVVGRFLRNPGPGHNGDLLVASDAVKRRLASTEPAQPAGRAGKWRFWA